MERRLVEACVVGDVGCVREILSEGEIMNVKFEKVYKFLYIP